MLPVIVPGPRVRSSTSVVFCMQHPVYDTTFFIVDLTTGLVVVRIGSAVK